ncbi:MAG: UDP-N-acetylmuramoyl-tripeptide--D-alanyl-D-alanine ligase [Patescibacteria group bacterium]
MVIRNLLYILQSEGYDSWRFLKYAYSHWRWWQLEKRQHLEWTAKVILVYIFNCVLMLALVVVSWWWFSWWFILVLVVIWFFLPVLIVFSLLVIWPVDQLLKWWVVAGARQVISKQKMIKIGITGSYGKTSMKEILVSLLREKYKIVYTPDNINTLLGIARFISKELDRAEILIVEMGAYSRKDIVDLCDLIEPDYSVLTGISLAHLDRFGNLDNIIQAKFELPSRTREKSILNLDDEYISLKLDRLPAEKIVGVGSGGVTEIDYLPDYQGLKFRSQGRIYQTKLLARHNINMILMGVVLARELGLSEEQIERGVAKIEPIAHRLQPIYHEDIDVWILDDSYNANVEGIKSGIEVLNRAGGRKIVLTPGPLVELGEQSRKIHREIGYLYADNVDLVLLIKSRETGYVIEGLKEKNFTNFRVFATTTEAHRTLPNIMKGGDIILLQNDWPDVYF